VSITPFGSPVLPLRNDEPVVESAFLFATERTLQQTECNATSSMPHQLFAGRVFGNSPAGWSCPDGDLSLSRNALDVTTFAVHTDGHRRRGLRCWRLIEVYGTCHEQRRVITSAPATDGGMEMPPFPVPPRGSRRASKIVRVNAPPKDSFETRASAMKKRRG